MEADKILQRAFAEMRQEMPQRPIATRRAHPKGAWLAAAAAIAAGAFLTIRQPAPEPDFVCWVGGVQVTDRDEAAEIARRTLAEVDERVTAEINRINQILNN